VLIHTVGAAYELARRRAFSEAYPPHVRIGPPDAPTLETPIEKLRGIDLTAAEPTSDGTFLLPIFDELDFDLFIGARRRAYGPLSSRAIAGVAAYQLPTMERLACSVWLEHEPALFRLFGIGRGDTLLLSIFSKTRIVASVQHSEVPDACWAECANGDTGQPCVECKAGDMRITVCC
jgi:hypothetical protein